MRLIRNSFFALGVLSLGACDLNLQNPNAPTEEQVTTSADGVIALATGLQYRFSQSYGAFAYMAGLVTDEFSATTAALISVSDAEQGSVAPGTAIADNVFNNIYRTVRTANDLVKGADELAAELDPGTRSGLKALAYALKGESLGEALQSYQQIPINTYGIVDPTYVPRSEALPVVRAILDSAANEIATTPPSAFFNANILTPGVNLPNIVHLFRARYARIANDHAAALAAANLVPRSGGTAISALTFNASVPNFFANVTGGTNGISPRDQFRLSMAPGDGRAAYFVVPTAGVGRLETPIDLWARYSNTLAPLPVYFPDEALLIKAEALANLNQLAAAQAALDSVRTDCPGGRGIDDPKACLPALTGQLTQAQLLAEIYVQRRYELFATGSRWEDARRRNLVRGFVAAPAIPLDAQRCWLPYPIGDRNANPNVPPDPTEPTSFPSGCPL
jgi:hypothetical protein